MANRMEVRIPDGLPEWGKLNLAKLLIPVVVVAVVVLTAVSGYTYLEPGEVGVKVNMLGGGINKEDYGPGYYFLIPGMHKMYRLDPTVQVFQWGGKDRMDESLRPRALDEYITQFDISILYRIQPERAHRIVEEVGMEPGRISEFVKSKSKQALWDVLGNYRTEDFYNVVKREEARADAKRRLAEVLAPRSLELIDILIRDIEYDPKFEEILVQKQLLGQNKALNVEKAKLEKELEKTQSIERETSAKVKVIEEEKTQEVENIVAETDAKTKEIQADADLAAQKLLAEADRYRRTRTSEGELAKTQAKAKGEKAINEAYQGLGGQAYITRQMIDAIEFGDIEINTNQVNPFDVDQLLRMFGLDPGQLGETPPAGPGEAGKKDG
jgi:regulator of protease activity HflC (stomatin/prohibitin superfamily)